MNEKRRRNKGTTIDRREVRTFTGRLLKSDALGDLKELISEYPSERGWKERLSRRVVIKYPDGLWYGETVMVREVNDTL